MVNISIVVLQVFWPTTEEPVIFGSIAARLKNRITEPVETLDVTLNVFTNGKVDMSHKKIRENNMEYILDF